MLEKNHKIHIEDVLRVLDSKGNLIRKAPMSNNITFKIGLNVMNHKCFTIIDSREEIIWNYRLWNLTFIDLNFMQKNGMVSSLPQIPIPSKVCEECVQAKHHMGSFRKDT